MESALERASQSRAMAFSMLFFWGGVADSPFPIEIQRFLNIKQGLSPGYFEILLGLPQILGDFPMVRNMPTLCVSCLCPAPPSAWNAAVPVLNQRV